VIFIIQEIEIIIITKQIIF